MTELLLYIFRGLPASGKTTLARGWVAKDPAHRARSNRDDLRRSLHDGVYLGQDTERQIVRAQDSAIRALLEGGVSVACDDTNLSQRRARELARIAARAGATARVWDLTDVPLELCLARDRDSGRDYPVGEEVIRGMYDRYLRGKAVPLPFPRDEVEPAERYVPHVGAAKAVMVDLDGTLCLHDGRSPFDESRVGEDLPNRAVVLAVEAAYRDDYRIVFCSGRTEGCIIETRRWIREHVFPNQLHWVEPPPWEFELFMRPVGDTRKDSIVKREIFDAHIRDRYDVVYVLDDRQQVVDMWRQLGLAVFQVAPGDF